MADSESPSPISFLVFNNLVVPSSTVFELYPDPVRQFCSPKIT